MTAPTHAYINLDGQKIAYTVYGDSVKPGLVLVHGWLSHGGVWRYALDELARHYCCICVDLLGFGHSDKPRGGDYSIAAQARRVLAVADAVGWNRFSLMGHSMGGQISLYVASVLAPERIVRLVDVAGVASGRLQPFPVRVTKPRTWAAMYVPALVPLSRWMHQFPAVRRFEFDVWFWKEIPDDLWAEDVPWTTVDGIHNSAYPAVVAIESLDLTAQFRCIQAPTLVIFGRRDQVVPPLEGDLVAKHTPNARIVWIDECGHFPMIERRDAFMTALRGFLL